MADAPKLADLSKVDPNMPMRLDVAARLAFPDGSIGASALRSEAKKGRLVLLKIAGKDMTTLAEVAKMFELCRVQPSPPAFGSSRQIARQPPCGSSKTERLASARDAALETARKLREH